ncbi:MAG: non-ribosomal peptide synthetase [Pantoea agglomerans]
MEEHAFDQLSKLSASARDKVLQQVMADPVKALRVELSYAQRRVWFLQRLVPDSPGFNIPEAFRLTGPLNVQALKEALSGVVVRHRCLRARFPYSEGRPLRVHSSQPFNLEVVAQGPCSDEEVVSLVENDAEWLFNLEADSLLRCRLYVLGPQDHLLTVNLHHIIADGVSLQVFYSDVSRYYLNIVSGNRPDLLPLERGYDNYITEQRLLLESEALKNELNFWRTYLRGAPALLDLPTDYRRPLSQSFRSGLLDIPLAENVLNSLKNLVRAEQATLFMALLACYAMLLYKFTGQTDLLIGTPVAGRSPPDQDQIGFYVNTVIVRIDLSDNPSFLELLRRVRQASLSAYEHDKFPLDLLIEHLNPPRDPASNPLFQVYFSHDNQLAGLSELGDAQAERVEVDTRISARFDLSLAVVTTQPGVTKLKLGYSSDLFESSTITALLHAYHQILAEVTAAPTISADVIPLLNSASRDALISRWTSDRALDNLARPTLHSLIEREARRNPHAIAVAWRHEEMTYSELDNLANKLANTLRDSGVWAGEVVAVCVERDLNLVVTLLAILKAGGAYLAIDPHLPPDQIAYLFTDSAANIAVIKTKYQQVIANFSGTIVNLDELDLNKWSDNPPPTQVSGNDLAYIVYTSGSTGMPKGIAVEHRSVVNLVEARQAAYGAHQFQSVLASSSVSFDSAVSELFVALTCGGMVVMVENLFDLIDSPPAKSFSMLETVPSLLRELLARSSLPPSVRSICLGGEQVTPDLVEKIYATGTVERLYNTYGPTETTVSATRSLVPKECDRPLIGTAIAGVRTYVLDKTGQPVPPGFRGELYIGGVGVARGYLNQPELTAYRFVQDDLSSIPNARMYRTGDIVRERNNGQLDWLGRDDRQVKILGRRIEPGEVEYALRLLPNVSDAAVVVRNNKLCAYLVASSQDIYNLRTSLSQLLPGALIPTTFVFVESLPLNAAGKLDEKSLPEPPMFEPVASRPPSTQTEIALMKVWSEVLGLRKFGVDDNFFDLGGHSLLVIRLVDRIQNALGLSIRVDTIFANPTIAGIAARLDKPDIVQKMLTLLPLRINKGRLPVICIHPAAGLGWSYQTLLAHLPEDQPVYALQDPFLAGENLETDRIAFYADTIRSVADNCILVGWSTGAVMAHALAQQIQTERLILIDGYPHWKPKSTSNTLTQLLISFGYDVSSVSDYSEFKEILTKAGSPLASFTNDQVEVLCNTFQQNVKWMSGYNPDIYTGKTVIVHSDWATSEEAAMHWHPYLNGNVRIRASNLPHGKMLNSNGAAIIASEINSKF